MLSLYKRLEKTLKSQKKVEELTNQLVLYGLVFLSVSIILIYSSLGPFNILYSIGLAIAGLGLTLLFSAIQIAATRIYSEQSNENQQRLFADLNNSMKELNFKIDKIIEIINKGKETQES